MLMKKKMKINDFYNLLNDSKTKFEGVDGMFYFKNNVISRELNILQILNGKAIKIK